MGAPRGLREGHWAALQARRERLAELVIRALREA
jgi:hypothetical protein